MSEHISSQIICMHTCVCVCVRVSIFACVPLRCKPRIRQGPLTSLWTNVSVMWRLFVLPGASRWVIMRKLKANYGGFSDVCVSAWVCVGSVLSKFHNKTLLSGESKGEVLIFSWSFTCQYIQIEKWLVAVISPPFFVSLCLFVLHVFISPLQPSRETKTTKRWNFPSICPQIFALATKQKKKVPFENFNIHNIQGMNMLSTQAPHLSGRAPGMNRLCLFRFNLVSWH